MAATALSSRERYLTAFRHQEPDRVPIHLELPAPMFFPPRVHFYNQLDRAELLLELSFIVLTSRTDCRNIRALNGLECLDVRAGAPAQTDEADVQITHGVSPF